jgi:hypothetical protein
VGLSIQRHNYIHFGRHFEVRVLSAMLLRQVWRSETKGNSASHFRSLDGTCGLPAAEIPVIVISYTPRLSM